MTDTAAHTETPAIDVEVAETVETTVVETIVEAPTETPAEAEAEPTFSTAVEPSDAPVEHGETSAEEAAEEAKEEAADDASPPASAGSDKKKSSSWIAKLTSNIKKLGEKKPKAEKAASADGEATEEAAAEEAEATPEVVTAVVEEVTTAVEEVAPDATETTEEKSSELATGDAPAVQKLAKRLSFNIFKKKEKKDTEKAAPVAEAVAETEEAPAPPSKDAPVIETPIPAETAVEETAVATAH